LPSPASNEALNHLERSSPHFFARNEEHFKAATTILSTTPWQAEPPPCKFFPSTSPQSRERQGEGGRERERQTDRQSRDREGEREREREWERERERGNTHAIEVVARALAVEHAGRGVVEEAGGERCDAKLGGQLLVLERERGWRRGD